MKIELCEQCGHQIPKVWGKHQRFCCDHCRRKYQDERRKEERRLERERRELNQWFRDPWKRDDSSLDIGSFSLDGRPMSRFHDQCDDCKWSSLKNHDLICSMCRDGCPI